MRQRSDLSVEGAATAGGIPVAPDMTEPRVPIERAFIDKRVVLLCLSSVVLAIVTGFIAQGLVGLIGIVTNIAFYGRFSTSFVSPAGNRLGLLVLVVPAIGGLIVGVMARYGSKAIRGHGIPEAMEQVLLNESRIPARITFLKPVSAAISIGTGGPFGAEGPIIATGGALGSLIGQILKTTADERKILLAAGAAAGMAATFGSPVSAVLLAVELLLFEFRPRSIIPVALAAAAAAGVRMKLVGADPIFAMPILAQPTFTALCCYILMGGVIGLIAAALTRALYFIEDGFDHLPVHWMWWPAIGAVAVGIVGWLAPDTLGVGYYNIRNILSPNKLTLSAIAWLCTMKFISWSISLGSGTSGGTLAPLATLGAGIGALFGAALLWLSPNTGIDLGVAALVGMASLFAGASRAMLASVVFAFETTLQPLGLLPLLGSCAASYLVSSLLMRNSIMTEKIARRGVQPPAEYVADVLTQTLVRDVASKGVISLQATETVAKTREWLATAASGTTHQGFPILDKNQCLVGVLTRRDLLDVTIPAEQTLESLVRRAPKFIYDDCTVRQAADHMVNHGIGRLPVVRRGIPPRVVGMVTRSDVLSAFRHGLHERSPQKPTISMRIPGLKGKWPGQRTPKTS